MKKALKNKKQRGFSLIGVLLIIGTLLITAGGVVVWNRKIVPTPTPTPTLPVLDQDCASDNDCPKQFCQPPGTPCAQYYCVQGKCQLVDPQTDKQYPSLPKLEFSFRDCDQFVGTETRGKLGVDEIQWLDNTTLLVKAFVSINCAEKMTSGSFEISGDTVTLKYHHTKCTECTSCECIHELTYRFTNLGRGDYQFKLSSVRQ